MADQKAQLNKGNTYQELIALLRVVEMVIQHAFDEPGPTAIIVESAKHGTWDDVVEVLENGPGSERYDAWQIKRGELTGDDLVRLVRELQARPSIQAAHLGLRRHVEIAMVDKGDAKTPKGPRVRPRKVGSTDALETLCNEARKTGAQPSELARTNEQRAFFKIIADEIGAASDDDTAALLRRLHVDVLGTEDDVSTLIRRRLGTMFRAPVDGISDAMRTLVGDLGPSQRATADIVEREVLSRFSSQRLPLPRTTAEARTRWLTHVEMQSLERHVLAGVASGALMLLPDVWIDVSLALDRDQTLPGRPLHEQMTADSKCRRRVVLGDVGTGKTELLRSTAAALARQAQRDGSAPVPLLVSARDIGRGIEGALRVAWPFGDEDALKLWAASSTRFFVLVDGLDEAGPAVISSIEALERELGNRLAGILIASRPVLNFRSLKAEEVWLGRWSTDQSERFLSLWAEKEPKAVDALRASPHRKGIAELLARPLTATLCLLVAEREPEALRSRTSVYHAVVTRLVDDWFQQRGISSSMVGDLVSALQLPALELVRQEHVAITEAALRRALGRSFLNQETTAVLMAEVHLGLLIRRGDGAYDFAFRGLAEHLAGRALVHQGTPAVVTAAHVAWGQEAARHAVGWAERMSDGGSVLVSAILEGEEEDDISTSNKHLRAVLVAIRTCSDLDGLDAATIDRLVAATWRRLVDETSVWVGEQLADAAQEWMRARGVGAEALSSRALKAVYDARRSPAAWYAAQEYSEPESWSMLLYHREPAVRAVAVNKLAYWVDDAEVRTNLLWALLDRGMDPGIQPVAMVAGVVLRKARRDKGFVALHEVLLSLLQRGGQFQRAGAALALHPGEASVEALASGLHRGLLGSGFGVPAEVLEELSATDDGRAALDRASPNWRDNRPEMPALEGGTDGAVPPVSWGVRRRLLRIASSTLNRGQGDIIGLLHGADRMALTEYACDIAVDAPGLILALLESAPAQAVTFFWDKAQLALGRAAARHSDVCRALIDLWQRLDTVAGAEGRAWPSKSDYPGRALEGLICQGNARASRIYAEWLRCANHAPPFSSFLEPLFWGGTFPEEIRRAGLDTSHNIWEWLTTDRVDATGHRSHGAPSAAGAALYRLSMFWQDDEEFRGRVEGWVDSDDFDEALFALQAVVLAPETRARVAIRVLELLGAEETNWFDSRRWWRLLHVIERVGMVDDIRGIIDLLSESESPLTMVAAALRLPFCGEIEQAQLAGRVARESYLVEELAPHLAERLVHAAPEAWEARLVGEFRGSWISGSQEWMPFVRALPIEHRRRVAEAWSHAAGELPWISDDYSSSRCVRAADHAREFLFTLGLEELGSYESSSVRQNDDL